MRQQVLDEEDCYEKKAEDEGGERGAVPGEEKEKRVSLAVELLEEGKLSVVR